MCLNLNELNVFSTGSTYVKLCVVQHTRTVSRCVRVYGQVYKHTWGTCEKLCYTTKQFCWVFLLHRFFLLYFASAKRQTLSHFRCYCIRCSPCYVCIYFVFTVTPLTIWSLSSSTINIIAETAKQSLQETVQPKSPVDSAFFFMRSHLVRSR